MKVWLHVNYRNKEVFQLTFLSLDFVYSLYINTTTIMYSKAEMIKESVWSILRNTKNIAKKSEKSNVVLEHFLISMKLANVH